MYIYIHNMYIYILYIVSIICKVETPKLCLLLYKPQVCYTT
jgi:hypothetical protein